MNRIFFIPFLLIIVQSGLSQSFELSIVCSSKQTPISGAILLLKDETTSSMGYLESNQFGDIYCPGACIEKNKRYSIEITAEGYYSVERRFSPEEVEQLSASHYSMEIDLDPICETQAFPSRTFESSSSACYPLLLNEEDLDGLSKKEIQELLFEEVNNARLEIIGLVDRGLELESRHRYDVKKLTGYIDLGRSFRDSIGVLNANQTSLYKRISELETDVNLLSQREKDLLLSLSSTLEVNKFMSLFQGENDYIRGGEFDFGTSFSYPAQSFVPIGWSESGHFIYCKWHSNGYSEDLGLSIGVLGMSGNDFIEISNEYFTLSYEDGPRDIVQEEVLERASTVLWSEIKKFNIIPSGIGNFQSAAEDGLSMKDLNQNRGIQLNVFERTNSLHLVHKATNGKMETLFEQDLLFWSGYLDMELESGLSILGVSQNPMSDVSLVFICSSYGGGFEGDVSHTIRTFYHKDGVFYGPVTIQWKPIE